MTVETFTPAPIYTVQNAGPYAIPHPYETGSIRAAVIRDGSVIDLAAGQFTVTPAAAVTGGDIQLTPEIAALHLGASLTIWRETTDEQGWLSVLGERERGLEVQMDRMVMALQELRRASSMTIRSAVPIAPLAPGADGSTLIWQDGNIAAGPDASDIDAAQTYAQRAEDALALTLATATLIVADLPGLLADTGSYPVGTVLGTRMEGYSYVVVSAGGHLTTAGGVQLQVAQRPRVTARAYGAAGDGVADDAAVLATAAADTRARGMILDGEGLTYRIDSALTVIPGAVENLIIDASGITASIAWDIVGPLFEAEQAITANALQGARQLNVNAHGYQAGDVVLARSDMLLETATNSVCAHWAEVVAATPNTITLSHALLCNLMSASNARVQRLPRVSGVRLRNVGVIGSATCPGGIQMTRLDRPAVEDCWTIGCEIRGVSLVNNYMPRATTVRGDRCDRAGFGYALNVSGNGWAEIGDTIGRRCRHVLTWGAANTVPSVGGSFGSVIGAECLGSVFDTHAGCIAIYQRGGLVIGDMAADAAGQDAVTMQSAGGSCRARITGTGHRHVCLVQLFHNTAAFQTSPNVEADIEGDTAGGKGITLDVLGTAGLRSAVLSYRGSASAEAVFVRLAAGVVIGLLDISGNGTAAARALLVDQQASGQIGTALLRGRWRTNNSAVVAAQVQGATDTVIQRTNINVAGLDAAGGTYGLRVDNRADARGASIAFLSGSTAATVTVGGGTIA